MRGVSRLTKILLVLAATVAFGLIAQSASATSGAHFFSASGSVADNGALQVSWDEAGVGNATVNYTLSAQSSATYACINGGGNHPKAANKQSVNGPLSSPNTGFKPQNGRVTVTNGLSVGPLPSTLVCPSGQTFVLACVSYTNITLTDTTNNVATNIADVSRTFVAISGC
jgi:hypothetical protein